MTVADAIRTKRAVRHFAPQPLPQRQVPYDEQQHLAMMARQALRRPEKKIA